MSSDRAPQRIEIITAFESGNDATARHLIGNRHQLRRNPDIIVIDEVKLRQRVFGMAVKASRNDQQFRCESPQSRENLLNHTLPKFARPGIRGQRDIDDISLMIFTLLIRSTGAGIIGILMGRGIHQTGLAPKCGLGAIAMMDVEIDHGDPLDAVNFSRLLRRDGYAVEKTKAHRPVGLGMVAGRAHSAKSIVGLALHHSINGGANRTDRAQRRPA